MDLVTTSLDALLHKATNIHPYNVDAAAVEAFCSLINKEKEGPNIAAKLLAMRLHSKSEYEALHTLTIIDTSMKRCKTTFQSEVGKFRFLNEMIKLVSPKYLAAETPGSIKQKVLQLLYIWTVDYPKETKIKEAYDMLRKQGVIRDVPLSVKADKACIPERKLLNSSVFHDEEKNKLLQKLLQSKNPDDLQAANRLIKNMVKEDDKRAEIKSRRITELESVHNNVRLLNEMLDSYKPEVSSVDELDLIKELHQSCERLRPNVFKLVAETQKNEEMLKEVLQASDELGKVFDKFTEIIVKGKIPESKSNLADSQNLALLDLASPEVEDKTLTKRNSTTILQNDLPQERQSDLDLLCDIFTSNVAPEGILKPISTDTTVGCSEDDVSHKLNKLKALDELDALGEHLMKENLVSTRIGPQFNKVSEKIPMNVLAKQSLLDSKASSQTDENNKLTNLAIGDALNLDLSYLVDKQNKDDHTLPKNQDLSGDDVLVDITEERLEQSDLVNIKNVVEDVKDVPVETTLTTEENKPGPPVSPKNKAGTKLNDIHIKLEEVKPSSTPPLVVLQEKNGITVTLHIGKNKPRADVAVIVVTTISKNELPLSNLLFQAVVPKMCKLKLQPPSGTELPAHNPFLPPSAITQIMLIANPRKISISLKFIISYVMDDETVTEMGEVDSLPVSHFYN